MAQKKPDSLFRLLMEDKRIFLRFCQYFFPMFPGLKLEDLEVLKTDTVDKDLNERRSDVLYRVKHRGAEVFVFILVEHQNAVRYNMSYRMLQYVMRILEHFVGQQKADARKKSFQLPAVLPVIFYNGDGTWKASRDIKELFPAVEGLTEYFPQMKSMVITLSQIPEEELAQLQNFLGVYLTLSNPTIADKYGRKIFDAIREMVKSLGEEDQRLLKKFALSIAQALGKNLTAEEIQEIQNSEGAENIMTTLEKLYLGNYEKGKAEGIAEGEVKGKAEGKAEGKGEILWFLLRKKFPSIPEQFREKLQKLRGEQLDALGMALLDAKDWVELEKFFSKS